jgi:hypothetical protein
LTKIIIQDNINPEEIKMTVLISPSDFAFLYDQSKWGFYNKYKNGIKRPTVIMPKIFTLIDHSFKESFLNQNLYSICKDLPDATFRDADKWVVSKEISNPSFPDIKVQIRGKIDAVFAYPDESFAIIDLKTSDVSDQYAEKYKRQLMAYSYAVKNPEDSKAFHLDNLKNTGLLIFDPKKFHIDYNSKGGIKGDIRWLEYELDLDGFESFIVDEVIPLLAGKEPAPTNEDPQWEYLKQFGFEYVAD